MKTLAETFVLNSLTSTIIIAGITAIIFVAFQFKFFFETKRYRILFHDFFKKLSPYATTQIEVNNELFTQLEQVGKPKSDLNNLIAEINHYVVKTKGTSDFSVIQNKVERKLNMRYDQSTAKLSFPTYIGLMGTFVGVFLGILMFVIGFNGTEGVTDDSIRNLLIGVLVSMSTSFLGLYLTTRNNAFAAEARKKIEEDKNEFYDFVQTELMPTLDVSMVSAISKLHETISQFEPTFTRVLNKFQTTFDNCTTAFGKDFAQSVSAVSNAVDVMGRNMDKINENIRYQDELLTIFRSRNLIEGMEKYIEAANHFVGITQSLNKFEEARRMMLAATQESINIQNMYSESLKIPREVAVRVNSILDRIKNFENSINELGPALAQRQIMGNDVLEHIQEQVNALRKKNKIANKYIESADEKLEEVFKGQLKALENMNRRYQEALTKHIEGFEQMLEEQTAEVRNRHAEFSKSIEESISVEAYKSALSPLKQLGEISEQVSTLSKRQVRSDELGSALENIQSEIKKLDKKTETKKRGFLGFGKRK